MMANEENNHNQAGELNESDRSLDARFGSAMRDLYLDDTSRVVGERVYGASAEYLAAKHNGSTSMRFSEQAVESALPMRSFPAWVVYGALAASILAAFALVMRFSTQSAKNNEPGQYVLNEPDGPSTQPYFVEVDAEFDEGFSTQTTALYTDIVSESGDVDEAFGWDSYDGALAVEIELAAQRLWDELQAGIESDG